VKQLGAFLQVHLRGCSILAIDGYCSEGWQVDDERSLAELVHLFLDWHPLEGTEALCRLKPEACVVEVPGHNTKGVTQRSGSPGGRRADWWITAGDCKRCQWRRWQECHS